MTPVQLTAVRELIAREVDGSLNVAHRHLARHWAGIEALCALMADAFGREQPDTVRIQHEDDVQVVLRWGTVVTTIKALEFAISSAERNHIPDAEEMQSWNEACQTLRIESRVRQRFDP